MRGVAPSSERAHLEGPEAESSAANPTLGALPVQGPTRFGSLARRRRRGVVVGLSALMALVLLAWALPAVGSELSRALPFLEGREAESVPGEATEEEGATRNPAAGSETSGSSGAGEAERIEVPDVSDRDVVKAGRRLSRASLEVGVVRIVKSQREAGTVLRTKPSEGSAAGPETPVVLVASGGPTGIPPGFRNGDSGSAASSQYAN